MSIPVIATADTVDGSETMLMRQGGSLRRLGLTMLKAWVQPAPMPSVVVPVTVTEMFLAAVPAQIRTVAGLAAKGVKKDAPLIFCPTSVGKAGFAPVAVFSKADDTVDVQVSIPALTVGGSYTITGKVLMLQ